MTGKSGPCRSGRWRVLLDMAMIRRCRSEVVTSNPWVDKPHKYVGAETGGRADGGEGQRQEHRFTALNSFQIRINWDKVKQYDPILAWG